MSLEHLRCLCCHKTFLSEASKNEESKSIRDIPIVRNLEMIDFKLQGYDFVCEDCLIEGGLNQKRGSGPNLKWNSNWSSTLTCPFCQKPLLNEQRVSEQKACPHCHKIPSKHSYLQMKKVAPHLAESSYALLMRLWNDMVFNFNDENLHQKLMTVAAELDQWEFIEERYRHLAALIGEDPLIEKRQRQIQFHKLQRDEKQKFEFERDKQKRKREQILKVLIFGLVWSGGIVFFGGQIHGIAKPSLSVWISIAWTSIFGWIGVVWLRSLRRG